MTICPSCGNTAPDGAGFCPRCGQPLGSQGARPLPPQQPPPPQPPPPGQRPYGPVPYPPPPPRRGGQGCLIAIGGCAVLLVIGFIMLVVIGAAMNSGSSSSSSSTRGARSQRSSSQAAPQRNRPVTVLSVRGSGMKTTQTFTVGDEWDLVWSYNCASFADGKGNFQVYIERKGGGFGAPIGVNELGTGGDSTEHYHEGGTYYLEMNSECDWAVKVVDRS